MDVNEIVKALLCCTGSPRIKDCKERCRYFRGGNMNKCIPDMGKDVASALESMQEELDRVKAERDAAIRDLESCDIDCNFCVYAGKYKDCDLDCINCGQDCVCGVCRDNNRWQWRGLEGRTSHE